MICRSYFLTAIIKSDGVEDQINYRAWSVYSWFEKCPTKVLTAKVDSIKSQYAVERHQVIVTYFKRVS